MSFVAASERRGVSPPWNFSPKNPRRAYAAPLARNRQRSASFALRGTLMELMDKWKIQDALETYRVRQWGKGYFSINKAGHVTVHPTKKADRSIDLKELVDQ